MVLKSRCIMHLALYPNQNSLTDFADEPKMGNIVITNAVIEDSSLIAHIQVSSWIATYKDIVPDTYLRTMSTKDAENQWTTVIREQKASVLLARKSDQAVGFIAYGLSRDDDLPREIDEIYALYLDTQHCRRGIGSTLVDQIIKSSSAQLNRQIIAWVLAANLNALHFYKKMGFAPDGKEKTLEIHGKILKEIRLKMIAEASR